jgi:succinate-semialdehyde dehydrogenase/glutarate-semialdehyde dehydrogenase
MDHLTTLRAEGWLRETHAIGGSWPEAESGERYPSSTPPLASIGTIAWGGAAETRAAIAAAQVAFGAWSMTLAAERAEASRAWPG